MFYGNYNKLERWSDLQPELRVITAYLKGLHDFEAQQVVINGNIKANFLDYKTKQRETAIWEAHKKEIDLHYIVKGSELIDLAQKNQLTSEKYHEEDDYYLLHGTQAQSILLETGQFLLLFPDEPHRTGIYVDAPTPVQKIVFKIRK